MLSRWAPLSRWYRHARSLGGYHCAGGTDTLAHWVGTVGSGFVLLCRHDCVGDTGMLTVHAAMLVTSRCVGKVQMLMEIVMSRNIISKIVRSLEFVYV